MADHGGQIPNLFVTSDRLAVLHPRITKMTGKIPVEIDTRDHQRSEKISLAAFINAEVRLELFRRIHLFVTKSGFPQHFGFEHKGNEIFQALSLNNSFGTLFINRYRELLLARRVERIGLFFKNKSPLLQCYPQLFGLLLVQRDGLGMKGGRHGDA